MYGRGTPYSNIFPKALKSIVSEEAAHSSSKPFSAGIDAPVSAWILLASSLAKNAISFFTSSGYFVLALAAQPSPFVIVALTFPLGNTAEATFSTR